MKTINWFNIQLNKAKKAPYCVKCMLAKIL